MTGDPHMFATLEENGECQEKITFGDNSKGKVKGLGKIAISNDHSLSNVLYVASLSSNLLSVSQLCDLVTNAYSLQMKLLCQRWMTNK
jgi:hypothetical protein